MDLLEAFPTEQACVQYLINVRHNGKMDCPHCNNSKVYSFKDGKTFKCAECKKHLQKYLIECDFRYNTKEFETESARFDCFLQNKASKLSYKKLIA